MHLQQMTDKRRVGTGRYFVMIMLNDYLYSGSTVLKILREYSDDLRRHALGELHAEAHSYGGGGAFSSGQQTGRLSDLICSDREAAAAVDLLHSHFLMNILEQLEHNDFLTFQSNRIREFYKYMADRYPFLAFTLKGRIKSLIRSEEKFNGYIVEYIHDYYVENGTYPPVKELERQLMHFRDFIAYRIVISIPRCHLKPGEDREEVEIRYLYEIANALPGFLGQRQFTAEPANVDLSESRAVPGKEPVGAGINPALRPFYRDYVAYPKESGYRSLHIAFFDRAADDYIEVQLRTHEMDDFAEIGMANHALYQQAQNYARRRRDAVPLGECRVFDEAYERGMELQNLDLSKIDVNMFTAYSNKLMNDGCGLYRGRLILPFEHLSRFQNDLVG